MPSLSSLEATKTRLSVWLVGWWEARGSWEEGSAWLSVKNRISCLWHSCEWQKTPTRHTNLKGMIYKKNKNKPKKIIRDLLHRQSADERYLGAWLISGCGLYLGKLWDLNSSTDEIPGQFSSVGVPTEMKNAIVPMRRQALSSFSPSCRMWPVAAHPVTWRWGGARPPRWSRGTVADLQPSRRIYSRRPWGHARISTSSSCHIFISMDWLFSVSNDT